MITVSGALERRDSELKAALMSALLPDTATAQEAGALALKLSTVFANADTDAAQSLDIEQQGLGQQYLQHLAQTL